MAFQRKVGMGEIREAEQREIENYSWRNTRL